jgi:UDP-4-amino-4-deoxy-L-arabinose-oxoglutarate aminotransferase
MISHSRPWVTEADLAAVDAVLRSELIGEGTTTARFEAAVSRWLDVEQPGVAVSSGAAALHVALLALGVNAGDEVILPTYVCRSVLDAIRTIGATALLADVGPEWVLTPSNVTPLISARTRAIVVPHIYGIFAEVAAFRSFGVPIVEDCAQAIDRPDRWKMAGDVGVFSFHPTKCLTTGEGGLAVARDPILNERLRAVRDGGTAIRRVLAPLSSVAAALGLSQLARYDTSLARRRRIAVRYRHALGDAATTLLRRTPWDRTMHFRFVMSSDGGVDASVAAFARRGIIVRRGVDELLHRIVGESDRRFPVATELFETTVSVPIYPALSDSDIATCADAVTVWASRCLGKSVLQPGNVTSADDDGMWQETR